MSHFVKEETNVEIKSLCRDLARVIIQIWLKMRNTAAACCGDAGD